MINKHLNWTVHAEYILYFVEIPMDVIYTSLIQYWHRKDLDQV